MEMNDQTIKADAGKLELDLVPTEIIKAIAQIRHFGVEKYKDPDNWKRVEKRRYVNAMLRHMLAYVDNPDARDEESGLPAIWHCACNIAFLCEMEKERYAPKIWVIAHKDGRPFTITFGDEPEQEATPEVVRPIAEKIIKGFKEANVTQFQELLKECTDKEWEIRERVFQLADEIGINKLYSIVREIRGE